ncbi:MAG: cardiolipin synthase [Myxococcales bacterium]|nr:cardiolipin synthase [Myxococcales bacterium]
MASSTLFSALALLEVAYVVALGAWILLEKRSPVATLAWLLALVALPGVGFVVYFFLGPRRLRRRRLKRLRASQAALKPDARPALSPSDGVARDVVRVAQRAGGARLSVAESVAIFTDGAATFDAIVTAIGQARDHVHVLYYIFENDSTGARVRDALVERARAGVHVRVLVDGVGSVGATLTKRFMKPLTDAGAKVAVFNRPRLFGLGGRVLNFRNHRKIVIVDGNVGFTGGVNVTDDENGAVNKHPWRDTHVRLTGPCVTWLQVVFLEDWCYATGGSPSHDARPAFFPHDDATLASTAGPLVQILESGPDRDHQVIRTATFAAINGAASRILLTSAYFVPDEPMLLALKAAAMRGVDVRVLVPAESDSRVAAAAARSYYDELLRAGVLLYEYGPPMLHAKTLVVDDALAFVGTANLDNRSFRLNFEVTALILDAATNEALSAAFQNDLSHSRAITKDARARLRLTERLAEALARLLSPVL